MKVNGKDYPIYYGKKMFQTTNQLQCVPVNIATSMFVCWNRYSWQCRGVLYPRSRPEFKHSEPYVSSLNMHSKSFKHEMPREFKGKKTKLTSNQHFSSKVNFLRSSIRWLSQSNRQGISPHFMEPEGTNLSQRHRIKKGDLKVGMDGMGQENITCWHPYTL